MSSDDATPQAPPSEVPPTATPLPTRRKAVRRRRDAKYKTKKSIKLFKRDPLSANREKEAKAKYNFLRRVEVKGSLRSGCKAAGISRDVYYRWVAEDEDFRERVMAAIDMFRDSLEDELHRRAVEGVDKPIVYQGKIMKDERTGKMLTVKEYSDLLLIFRLKGERPNKYKEDGAGDEGGFRGQSKTGLGPVAERLRLTAELQRRFDRLASAYGAREIPQQPNDARDGGAEVPLEVLGAAKSAPS